MVLLTTTPQILAVLSSLPPSAIATLNLPPSTETETEIETDIDTDSPPTRSPLPTTLTTPISHTTLIALSRLRLSSSSTTTTKTTHPPIPSLNDLLRGTKPYTPPPPPPPTKTPEYLALMARLHAEKEQRQYNALLTNTSTSTHHRRSSLSLRNQNHSGGQVGEEEEEEEEDTLSPTLVLNILLSVLLCAIAVFQLTKYWSNDGVRVLLSLGVGIVVGLAEAGVYSIYLVKKRRGRERERKMVERKMVVGRVEWDGDTEEGVKIVEVGVGDGDGTEEIWGRGVNGGMRRRVRERWEREQEKEKEKEKEKGKGKVVLS